MAKSYLNDGPTTNRLMQFHRAWRFRFVQFI